MFIGSRWSGRHCVMSQYPGLITSQWKSLTPGGQCRSCWAFINHESTSILSQHFINTDYMWGKMVYQSTPILKILSKWAPETSKCWSRSSTVCCTDSLKSTSAKTNYCKTFSLGSLFYPWEKPSGGSHKKKSYFNHTHIWAFSSGNDQNKSQPWRTGLNKCSQKTSALTFSVPCRALSICKPPVAEW